MTTIRDAAQRVLLQSDGLRRACVVRSPLAPWLVDERDVAAMLRALPGCPDREQITRVFVDGGERLDARRRVFESPPRDDESLASWARRLFGEARFGVILYKAEQLDDDLVARLARFFEPIVSARGLGLAGREVFVFLGNYGYTPVGAHKDREQGDVVHFHVGPGTKVMTLWTDAQYEAATGSRDVCLTPASILDAGRSHHIDPGDVFVLPRGGYHVGFCPELSASVTVASVDATASKVLDLTLAVFQDKLVELIERDQPLATLSQGPQARLRELSELLGRPLPVDLGPRLEAAFQTYQRSLLSNAGFSTPPPTRTVDARSLADATLRVRQPFELQCARMADEVAIYVRRRRITLPWHDAWPAVVASLNEGEPMPVATLVAQLDDEWTREAALYALSLLVSLGGVEVVSHDP